MAAEMTTTGSIATGDAGSSLSAVRLEAAGEGGAAGFPAACAAEACWASDHADGGSAAGASGGMVSVNDAESVTGWPSLHPAGRGRGSTCGIVRGC